MIENTFAAEPVSVLPNLTLDEREDAEFRGKDRAWASLVSYFDRLRSEDEKFSYRVLGERIGRSRKQVHRWLSSPANMTFASFGLLAEGMDADIDINVATRCPTLIGSNCYHPSDGFIPTLPRLDKLNILWASKPQTSVTADPLSVIEWRTAEDA